MPIVKKPDGWYWGSQGPFDTREEAERVARAAYANGYGAGEERKPITRKG
jgi:hypothetical protein